jgi:hypothetical protein
MYLSRSRARNALIRSNAPEPSADFQIDWTSGVARRSGGGLLFSDGKLLPTAAWAGFAAGTPCGLGVGGLPKIGSP